MFYEKQRVRDVEALAKSWTQKLFTWKEEQNKLWYKMERCIIDRVVHIVIIYS